MIPLFKVAMSENVTQELEPVLKSGFIGQGPKVEEFERELQKALGLEEPPLTTNSCTSALDLALHLAGIGPGDLVLSTPITCLASNTVIHNRGATIAWVDVDPLTGNMSLEDLEQCLTLYPEAKAIMVVDWAGRCAATEEMANLVNRLNPKVYIIEDAAHAFGNPLCGKFSDYCAWSFQAIKHLTTGDGGALKCPAAQRKRAELLRWYGLDRTLGTAMRCTQIVPEIGMKYQMNDIAATIGLANLDLATSNIRKHKEWSKVFTRGGYNTNYFTKCEFVPGITNPKVKMASWDANSPSWIFTMLVEDRDAFIYYMKQWGIEASLVHVRNDIQPKLRHTNGHRLPGVDRFAKEAVSLPCGWWLSEADVKKIIEVVNGY